ncbi:iron ABC transporter permease [Thalassospira sp. MA62]|nr:iron ABC transporter permease [Thalassospira sp. MA62]
MMHRQISGFGLALVVFVAAAMANLGLGASPIPVTDILSALFAFDPDNYDHFIIVYQRLPRVLIAVFIGAVMAAGGAVLQGLMRNPLAAPSVLGINGGATVFVVGGAVFLGLGTQAQGIAALIGGAFGFVSCLMVARLAGGDRNPQGLPLILSGAVVSMLYIGISNALLLSNPQMRNDFLGWLSGNINHVYVDRLDQLWWVGVIGVAVLLCLARALTLISFGAEKAASAGVNVGFVRRTALIAVVLSSSAAVAICGPVGFVGLVVPHIVRPLVGAGLTAVLPTSILLGATVCLIADMFARMAFAPYVLHTGVMMDLVGGIVFAVIVRRHYLRPGAKGAL